MDIFSQKAPQSVWNCLGLLLFFILLTRNCGLAGAEAECLLDYGSGVALNYTQDSFNRHACTDCYVKIANVHNILTHGNKLRFNVENGMLMENGTDYEPDPRDLDGVPRKSFRWEHTALQWEKCCDDARKCCANALLEGLPATTESSTAVVDLRRCESVWNFYGGCWPALQVNETKETGCSDYSFPYFAKSPCKQVLRRECKGDNKWNVDGVCYSLEFHRVLPQLTSETDTSLTTENTTAQKLPLYSKPKVFSEEQDVCGRTERRLFLSRTAFRLDTCAKCYDYLPSARRNPRYVYNASYGALWDKVENKLVFLDIMDTNSSSIQRILQNVDMAYKLLQCCQKAVECFQDMTRNPLRNLSGELFCPRTWDGWGCFPDTDPGTTVSLTCPEHIYFSQNIFSICHRGPALKDCLGDGTWALRPDRSKEWTDYVPCGNLKELIALEHFTLACFVISLVALIPALIIFSNYGQLRVARIQMHRNFFLALLLNSIFTIAYRTYVLFPEMDSSLDPEEAIISKNGAGCKVLLILTRYFRMCTYTWMLCEGFYLQRLITAAFAEQKKLHVFYIVGWVFPVLPITAYAIARKLTIDTNCWSDVVDLEWIQGSVNLSCILLNLIFLCNIIRVLITKLRSIQSNEPSHYRKAVRATLVLIPLFGAHFVLAMYHGNDDTNTNTCIARLVYKYFKSAIDGLQGFSVAVIFCYMNGEVIYLLKRSYERYKVSHGLQAATRSRLSMSTQMSQAPDHTATPKMTTSNGTAPRERNGSVGLRQVNKAGSEGTPKSEPRVPPPVPDAYSYDYDIKDFENVVLDNEKVTEL